MNAQFTVNSPVLSALPSRRAQRPIAALAQPARSPLYTRACPVAQARYVNDNFDSAKLNATFEKNKATRRATLMATQRIQARAATNPHLKLNPTPTLTLALAPTLTLTLTTDPELGPGPNATPHLSLNLTLYSSNSRRGARR